MSKLISDEMRELNAEMHRTDKSFGRGGVKAHRLMCTYIQQYDCKSVLDYGCGKATLHKTFIRKNNTKFNKVEWQNYDPAKEEYNTLPKPADLVVIRDVMEHVEPDKIDNVLKHIVSLTKKVAWFEIPPKRSKKSLPDGRNAHLVQEQPEWWAERIEKYFTIRGIKYGHSFKNVCVPIGVELDEPYTPPKEKKEIIIQPQ